MKDLNGTFCVFSCALSCVFLVCFLRTFFTKVQNAVDKEIFERHVKLQADLQRICDACDSITIFISL